LTPNGKRFRFTLGELYEGLREEFHLPSKIAEDCYRDASATHEGLFNDPNHGRFSKSP